jgi:penicillin-binding protein 2
MATIREALWAVVNESGTGAAAFVPGLDIAGKTGTVQVSARGATEEHEDLPWELRNHAWFASFAPARAPRLVVVVFIEHGGKGSRAAAPVAKAVYEKYLQLAVGQLHPS